ncbi:riboflavin synthase [Cellulomonas sp. NPDC089187]|uniref:riboflavin synthase n=1 Tax=Cellulomonas sp. NPDC089187 TaxID=3154970 RepID=UPI003444EDD3
MFTGIVEEVGAVLTSQDGSQLTIRGPLAASDARHGDSIAVDGVCLTVTELTGDGSFAVDVMPETLRRTALGGLRPGDPVNLERSLRADARLGGHVVQGHVDGVGTVLSRNPGPRWDTVRIGLDRELARLVAEKGAITVSGVSLTVTVVGEDWFEVGLIPTTLADTTLGALAVGARVNLEVDVLAKYVARLLETQG